MKRFGSLLPGRFLRAPGGAHVLTGSLAQVKFRIVLEIPVSICDIIRLIQEFPYAARQTVIYSGMVVCGRMKVYCETGRAMR